ncbi:hypothetical protein BB559_000413 [Furculomyces boomerangus]|uniref:Uncharacterized protein n=1 Tax=Furculomyces boomerangus TaxID=61424 RepID=A0A2T9Z5E6_9FUNG|nr:hypothetical protein BB559_000413 [Furculomyces boomerangus]
MSDYSKDTFKDFSLSKKSKIINQLEKTINKLSNNSPDELYEYFFNNSRNGKEVIKKHTTDFKEIKMRNNILSLHQNLPENFKSKSTILALVSLIYKREELRKHRFKFSKNQISYAIKKAESSNYSLAKPINQSLPNKISEETKKPIYYLEISKKSVYYKMVESFPENQIGLSTFYQHCPINFIVGKKRTDVCPICDKGIKNEITLKGFEKILTNKQILENPSKLITTNQFIEEISDDESANKIEEINKLDIEKLEMELSSYYNHLKIKNIQSEAYKNMMNNLKIDECILVMDFKENFRIGTGPIETSQQFYHKTQISNLGFALITKEANEKIRYKYFDYLSEILSQNSLFYHGKSVVDGHSGLLSR